MHTKFQRILTLGIIAVLLFATLPGQANQAQPSKSAIPIHNDQNIDAQLALDMVEQNIYHAQYTPLLPDRANNMAIVQTAIVSAKHLSAGTLEVSTNWIQQFPSISPYPIFQHAMAHDSIRGMTVLYTGGVSGDEAGTWEWDGTNWHQRNPANYLR